MSTTLDCSSYESAKDSIAKIFSTDETKIIDFLKNVKALNQGILKDYIYDLTLKEFGQPLKHTTTMWFHGTRTREIQSFKENGILPKSLIQEQIRSILNSLSKGLEKEGKYPNSSSVSAKISLGKDDEGPFAFLIKAALVHAEGSTHSYLNAPEIVQDIAGSILGNNFNELVDRYRDTTKPYVVSFLEKSQKYELPHALEYLYLAETEPDFTIFDAARFANTYFSSHGAIISTEKIVEFEEIP